MNDEYLVTVLSRDDKNYESVPTGLMLTFGIFYHLMSMQSFHRLHHHLNSALYF